MDKSTIDSIIKNLFVVLPFVHKKLLKIDLEGTNKNISRLHFTIMGILAELGNLPVSEVGRRLLIPKPQMTHLIDHMNKS